MKPHKHAELIKAWADGEIIEWQYFDGTWIVAPSPSWGINENYRLKTKRAVAGTNKQANKD